MEISKPFKRPLINLLPIRRSVSEDEGSTMLRNVGGLLLDYTALHSTLHSVWFHTLNRIRYIFKRCHVDTNFSFCTCLMRPIHDQSCCPKLFCATQVCPFTIKPISTINGQWCCTTRNVGQHDWSCMGPFRSVGFVVNAHQSFDIN
jgi:hypothetical protein